MIFTATTAKNYKHAFGELSTKVLLKCLKFFLDTKGGLDVCALIQETFDNFPGASLDILLELKKVKDEKMQGNNNMYLYMYEYWLVKQTLRRRILKNKIVHFYIEPANVFLGHFWFQ